MDYATSDWTAARRRDEDYTGARSGTLKLEAGESAKTVEVAVLDGAHDEGEERLSAVERVGGLEVGEATGTIENADLMPAGVLGQVRSDDGRAGGDARQGADGGALSAVFPDAGLAGRVPAAGQRAGDFALGFLSQFARPMGMGGCGGWRSEWTAEAIGARVRWR